MNNGWYIVSDPQGAYLLRDPRHSAFGCWEWTQLRERAHRFGTQEAARAAIRDLADSRLRVEGD